MPAVGETLRVDELADLNRAFRLADRTLARELRGGLRDAAEPVRLDAERLATARISRIGVPWSRMRVGVTTHTVYVAPRQRGTRFAQRKRSNIAGLLIERAMVPALRANELRVVAEMEQVLGTVGRAWENA